MTNVSKPIRVWPSSKPQNMGEAEIVHCVHKFAQKLQAREVKDSDSEGVCRA